MKNTILIIAIIISTFFGCQSGTDLDAKKAELAEAKSALSELQQKISALEEEISILDTTTVVQNAVLVSSQKVQLVPFRHQIKVRGSVASRKNVMISAEIMGRIEGIKVREGQNVSKGQVLLTLDADIIRNNIAELKTSLELATTVYEKQERLWSKNIGTEIQYLEAKNNKESLERKLATTNSQLSQSIVKAPFDGRIDDLPAKLGEMAQPGLQLVRMVSPESMYVEADISERFLGAFKRGDSVTLNFPIQNRTYFSKITAVGQVIDPENRTFRIEAALQKTDFNVKPNQVVVLRLTDYEVPEAILVPSEIILTDATGKYLYVVDKEHNIMVARRRSIEAGKTQDGQTEVVEGLGKNDTIVLEGYRDLNDGIPVKFAEKSTRTANL